jgi:pimeloyl-ACP methyl ester carboxylesterase
MDEITPFTIAIDGTAVDDLERRLEATRFPPQLPGQPWSKGVPVDYAHWLVDYWREQFDWRAAEATLNAIPQFTTRIDGARVHFIHARSRHPNAVPLLMTHGWPGSIVEFARVIQPLIDPPDPRDAFHVIAPSLPGYLYSDLIDGGTDAAAAQFATLMQRLGYDHYLTQGGDTGAVVAPKIARIAPDSVIGVHTNGIEAFWFGDESQLEGLTDAERERVTRDRSESSAYALIQGTRGQTMSYGLTDSPVAQLTWIAEKFHEWTHPARELPHDAVDLDQLLTNVSLYWFTATAATATENYWYGIHSGTWGRPLEYSSIPFGNARFPTDNSVRAFCDHEHNVMHWSEPSRGGHFAAIEAPDVLVDDIRAFARLVR